MQTRFEIHEYPSGRRVVKAFIREDFVFYDKQGRVITNHSPEMLKQVARVRIRFRIQKNRQNGQKITIVAEFNNVDICAVQAAYRIFLRSIKLG